MFTNSSHNFQKIKVGFLTVTEPRQLRSNYFGTVCTRKVWQFFLNYMISSSLPASLSFNVARGFSVANSNLPEDYVWGSILQKKCSFKIVSLPQHAFWKLINDFYDCCLLSLGFSRCRPNTTILSEILFKLSATGWSSNHQKEKRVLLRCCYSNLC